jgi:multicomponent Na+:H+ antiporter subunit C
VTVAYALGAAIMVACSLYMILSRNLMRTVLGITMLSTAINLILFLSGHLRSQQPPLIIEGEEVLAGSADPLSQALVLTAIVIGFALTVILAALALRAYRTERTLDAARIDSAER